MNKKNLWHRLARHGCYLSVFIFYYGSAAWTVAQELPNTQKNWVRWGFIEVARKSLADSIWSQSQLGESFQKLARIHSLHASASEGGEIGWTNLDSAVSEFKFVMEPLPIGETSLGQQKGDHSYLLHKINELSEIEYSRWNEQKSQVDSLLNRVQLFISTEDFWEAAKLIKTIEKQIQGIQDEAILRRLNHTGLAFERVGQFRSAFSLFDLVLKISKENGDSYWEGVALGNIGNVYSSLGQYQKALACHNRALIIVRDIGDRNAEATSLGNLGISYYSLAQFQQALAYYDSASIAAKEIGNLAQVGIWLGNRGMVYGSMGQHHQEITHYDSALVIARGVGDVAREEAWLARLGDAYRSVGHHPRAIAYFDSALAISRKTGDIAGTGFSLGRLGSIYSWSGNYSSAIAYYDSALHIAIETNDRENEGRLIGNLGLAYGSLGQYSLAIDHLTRALLISREIGDSIEEEYSLGGLGGAYHSLGMYSQAIAYFDSAIVVADQNGDKLGLATALGNQGSVYGAWGEYHKAIMCIERALSIARQINDRFGEGKWLGSLGNVHGLLRNYALAITYADSAMSIAKELDDAEGIWQQYRSLARSYSRMPKSKSHQVIAFYDSAVTAFENISQFVVEDPHKQSFLEDNQGLYRDFVNYLLIQGEPIEQQRALEISERARARAFMEFIARRFHGSEVELKRELLAPANFQQIQQTSHRFEASILEYFISDSSLVVWLFRPDGQLHTGIVPIKPTHFDSLLVTCYFGFNQIQERELAIQEPLFLATRNVRPVTGLSRGFDATSYFDELYRILFPNAIRAHLPQEDGAKLLLVPHRRLSIIPIMALKDSTGHCLLEKYSCHQVPSIGILLRTSDILEKRNKPGKIQGDEMILFGNPTMPTWGWDVLPPLRGAENEVKAIAGKFHAGFQIGPKASEYAFKSDTRNKRLLHLATHGISFDASPLESFVALAPGNGEDGQLTAAEILEMQFEADLVVLSACETGLGRITGDGVEGLARSFMASGVPSVLVSLWNVDDEATKALMVAFYENLDQGMDKAESLRQAQLKTMNTPKWRHPKYWAAFVLYGER